MPGCLIDIKDKVLSPSGAEEKQATLEPISITINSGRFSRYSHKKKVNKLTFKRKGGMGKRSFLIVWQQTTRRPPKKMRQQIRFFTLSAAALKRIAHELRLPI